MKKRKIFAAFIVAALMSTVLGITAFASETVDTPPAPERSWADTVTDAIASKPVNVTVKYSYDSVRSGNVSYEMFTDLANEYAGFKIVEDLPMGYVIYDDSSTDYIEGIRVNGERVDSTKILIDYLSDKESFEYTVEVKVVYADGLFGDIAKMYDGTYDWSALLSNPVVSLQIVYYALALISVTAGIIMLFKNKGKRVKTADEIASKVESAAHATLEDIKTQVVETVLAEATPVLQNILDNIQNVVKAITLSTSNAKEAPLALLDTLQNTANASVSKIIDEVRSNVEEHLSTIVADKEANLAALRSIANTSTEVSNDVEPESNKSVF